jgi:hypothetical protein
MPKHTGYVVVSEADRQQIVYLVREGKMTAADCARTYRIHESNVSRLLATAKAGLRRRLSLLVPRAAGLALLRLRNRIRPALVAGCWRRAVRRVLAASMVLGARRASRTRA